jgi:hypothetical protein
MSAPKDRDSAPPEHIEVFMDTRDSSFWYRLKGRFVNLGQSQLKLHFRTLGLKDTRYFNGIQEIEWPFWNAMNTRLIDYAGSLAGHRSGTFRDGSGRLFLVTDEAGGVWDDLTPKKSSPVPPFFRAFVDELLPGDQANYFLHWLAIGLRSMRRGDFQPGQAVILAGPHRCGKSLLQAIVTEVLGGRVANPSLYLFQKTAFNYDLAGAEHWCIEDPRSTTDMRTRRDFGSALKEATVNRNLAIHRKNKDALSLPIWRRVTLSVNDEPENLAVCPPIEPSIEDKLFLFHCNQVVEAFTPFRVVAGTRSLLPETRNEGELDRSALWGTINKEVPLIRAWLLHTFKAVPTELRDDRFGIRAWQHPELMEVLTEMSNDARLLRITDEVLFRPGDRTPSSEWKGASIDLEKLLRGSQYAFEVEKCLKGFGQCGSLLGKLSKTHPGRVTKLPLKDGYREWLITNPAVNGKEVNGNGKH